MITVTKKSRTATIKKAMRKLREIVDTIEEYKNCYFWKGKWQKGKEFDTSYNFSILGDELDVELSMSASNANVYFTKNIYVNDSKSNVRKIKGYITKLEKILEGRK